MSVSCFCSLQFGVYSSSGIIEASCERKWNNERKNGIRVSAAFVLWVVARRCDVLYAWKSVVNA